MYSRPTRRRSTPENTVFVVPFPPVRSRFDCTRAAVHISPCVSFVKPVCSPCIRRCVRSHFILCLLRVPVCIRPFCSPRVAFTFLTVSTVRFCLFPFPFDHAHFAFPCAFLPIEPARLEYFRLRS